MAQRRPTNPRTVQQTPGKRRSRRRLKPWIPFAGIGLLVVIIAVIVIILVSGKGKSGEKPEPGTTPAPGETTESTAPDETTTIGEPEIISSITVGSTGDILIHPSVLAAFDYGDHHDFNGAFTYVAPYYSKLDLMVVNLEVPLVDPDDGYEYSSNPFGSPDAVAEALKNAGADVCLTANNHTYDMGSYGLHRTQRVLKEYGLDYTGTRQDESDSFILVEDVKGIKLGMICYTYETGGKSLNYIPIDYEDEEMVNTFDYENLDAFYSDARRQLAQMDELGCDLKIFYLHWGEEYEDYPRDYQTEIAQALCDMGVDVIIGGHPHVVQMFDVLKSDNGHQMLCLYSMGNELSNQRRDIMNEDDYRGYTEDGIIFILNIDKYNTGDVIISGIDAIPTWVQRDDSFEIIPLDPNKDPAEWANDEYYYGVESYNRTMGRLGDAFFDFRAEHGQADIPRELEY